MLTYTIKKGERIALSDQVGRVNYIDGPKQVMTWGKKVVPMVMESAGPKEYLAITYKNGEVEHIAGPASIWLDTVKHEKVEIKQAIEINAHEAIVIYRKIEDTVDRKVIEGPALYVPKSNEWLHEFRWHGAHPNNPEKKVPRGLVFKKLRMIPDQCYITVEEVRTLDDALIKINLMIFFELVDINKMLDQTHDPIADFVNAAGADVLDFVGRYDFEGFKNKTDQLNDLKTYNQLGQRSERIGYKMNKVVYRGYQANTNLQAMHDHAIETRTKLLLESETEEKAQELADLKILREKDRAFKKQEIEKASLEHKNNLAQMELEERLSRESKEFSQKLEQQERDHKIQLDKEKEFNAEKLAFLNGMQAMSVDMTQYLVAQYRNPDRLIRIDQGETPQLHFHGEQL